jgi:hypothetical protein
MRERLARLSLRLGPPLGVGLVLGLTGPFGTYDLLSAPMRLAYWLTVVSANWLVMDTVLRRVEGAVGDRFPAPRFTTPLLAAILAAAPATGVVALANGVSGIGWPINVPGLFVQVLLLLAAISLPVHIFHDMNEQTADAAAPASDGLGKSAPPPQPFMAATIHTDGLALFKSRLPRPLEGRLLCLEMQDHYLVVHHSQGSEMILCRMEDAARELAGLGRRVHRSWWVANEAIGDVERLGGRVFLHLVDGRRVPVGRSYRPTLKAEGLL